MLSLNEIKLGKVITINGEPYSVIRADHHKMGRGGAVLKTKLRNLISSSVLEKTWQGNDRADEADVEKRKAAFMYADEQFANFMDNENYEQFAINLEELGGKELFLKDGLIVTVLYFEGRPVAVELPVKAEYKVVTAPPGVKGNTAGNVMKQIELETGAKINAPLFINEGDIIRVNTDTEEYVERVN
ncbi:MAG TPA: elongation factor P [bacterium]|nr:elongation factor P [bacterium]